MQQMKDFIETYMKSWKNQYALLGQVLVVCRLRAVNKNVDNMNSAIGCRNFAVCSPETWNSLPAELRLSTTATATFA